MQTLSYQKQIRTTAAAIKAEDKRTELNQTD